jgi:acetylserotonin N-methyltransferase
MGRRTVDLWDCALGFMDAQVLLTADELGVFDALAAGPRTAPEVAAAVGLPGDSALRLLTALCALGILERRPDGRLANGPEAAEQLVRGRPGHIGALFRHVREDLYPVWSHLKEALVEGSPQWERAFGAGQPPRTARLFDDPDALRAFLDGMFPLAYRAGRAFARRAPEVAEIGEIVDVGGASGAFLIALAEASPRLRGVVFDLPPVRPIAEETIGRYGLSGRLRFRAGDFWGDPIPAGADAYSLGFVLHDWDPEGGSRILSKVAEATRPGGLLIVGEQLLDDDRTGPRWAARQDLNMLVATGGRERTAAEYAEWIARFGFRLERVQRTATSKDFLVARRGAAAPARARRRRAPISIPDRHAKGGEAIP